MRTMSVYAGTTCPGKKNSFATAYACFVFCRALRPVQQCRGAAIRFTFPELSAAYSGLTLSCARRAQ